ncbi:MAG: pilus assembly protein [Pseudodesulfovibrio sp.]
MRNQANKRNRRGQTMVEVAILLPLFMTLMLGIMDFSRLYWTQSVVRGAAYEGVRMAILVEATDAQVESTIIEELKMGGVSVTPAMTVSERTPNTPVDVTVTVPFDFIAIDSLIPALASLTQVSATVVMTHER